MLWLRQALVQRVVVEGKPPGSAASRVQMPSSGLRHKL
jgi:hypothetical protein